MYACVWSDTKTTRMDFHKSSLCWTNFCKHALSISACANLDVHIAFGMLFSFMLFLQNEINFLWLKCFERHVISHWPLIDISTIFTLCPILFFYYIWFNLSFLPLHVSLWVLLFLRLCLQLTREQNHRSYLNLSRTEQECQDYEACFT